MATRRLLVEIVGDDASLQRTLGRSGAVVDSFGGRITAAGQRAQAVGKKLTTHLTLPLAVAGVAAFKLADDYNDATATIQQHIKTMGVEGSVSFKELADAARAFSTETGIAQTELLGASGKLVTFANVAKRGTQFLNETTEAAADLAAAGFGSIQSASVMLGKALNDPIRGMTALRRVGVSFSEAQEETIKKLVETGQTAKAQGIILKAVQDQVGGTAKKIADPWDKAKASLQAAAITIGTALAPVVAKVSEFVGRLAMRFQELSPGVRTAILVAAGLAAVIGPLVGLIGTLATAIGFLVANPITLLIAGIAVLVAGIAAAVIWPDKLKAALERMGLSAEASAKVVATLRRVFEVVKEAGERLVSAIRAHWDTIRAVLKGAWEYIAATVRNGLQVVRGVINVIGGLLKGDWGRVWEGIKQIVSGTLKQIWNNLHTQIKVLGAVASAAGHAIWNGIKAGADAVISWIADKIAWIAGKIDWLAGKLGSLKDKGGGILRGLSPVPLPHFAEGGIVSRPTIAMIGEGGPEAVVPLGGRAAAHFASRHGGGGAMVLHVTLNAPNYLGDKRELGETVVSELSKWARRNGNSNLRAVLGATG